MKSRMFFLFVLFILCENSSLLAQAKTVSGVIIDSKTSEPVSGASVSVKRTANGTSTDKDGRFNIQVSEGAVLVISNVGFETQEVHATTSQSLKIRLVNSVSELTDLVVVGYAKQKKATLTGAVEQISAKTFENRAVTNIGLALQGATPGLLVTRSSPRPGNEGIGLVIRGLSSVNGSAPLIIIDGVPALNSFSFLNMNSDDIESISVLKDASAAIYGSAAANGVILVSTKRGKGKTRYDFSSNMRFATNGITGYSPSMQQY
ncbi:MAG: TonB-dependent receptor plug domain-containing protein, partial [Ferruginibacter sp.]